MKASAVFATILLAVVAARGPMAPNPDEEAVRQAVLDYVEALYEVAPERIERSVHPDLHKFGFYKPEPGAEYQRAPMNYEQLHRLAARWNEGNRQNLTAETPKEIVVFDVLDKTASAKLVAQWGIDYFHLAKYDGQWQIVNVLWQSPPPQ